MIETHHLKNVAIFIQTILSFVLPRKIINIYNDITQLVIMLCKISCNESNVTFGIDSTLHNGKFSRIIF